MPQIATSDGGVIATTGAVYGPNGLISNGIAATFDANLNLTGQLGSLATHSWIGEWYQQQNSNISEVSPSSVLLAWSWASVAGGNPSGTSVYVPSLGDVEGKPRWWVKLGRALSGHDPCPKRAGTNKVLLSGAALDQYNALKQKLISWLQSLTVGSTCSQFFNSDTYRKPYFGQLVSTLQSQQAFDGIQCDINQYDAGLWNASMQANPHLSELKNVPVCDQLRGEKKNAVIAFSPLTTSHDDAYINTSKLNSLTQGTLLHETLHNLTALEDFTSLDERKLESIPAPNDLKTFVGIETTPGKDPNPGTTNDITIQLTAKGCVSPN